MISAYTGLPGSGKSYGVWEYVIVPALKAEREVWTNIPFDESRCMAEFALAPSFFSLGDIESDPAWFQSVLPKGVVIVIDECWRLWPSGLRATNVLDGHKSFLAEHRHLVGVNGKSTEIVLVTQDLSQLANFARSLVEYTYRAVKLSVVGKSDSFRVDVYSGAVTGQKPPKSARIRQMFGSYRPAIYNLYSSHTMSDTGLAGDETATDNRFNMLADSKLIYYGVLIVFLLIFVIWGFSRVTGFYSGDVEESLPADFPPPEAFGLARVAEDMVTDPVPTSRAYDVFKGRSPFITLNLGNYPNFDYRIAVREKGVFFELTRAQLIELGYTVVPISQCLLIVDSGVNRYHVACKDSDYTPQDNDFLSFSQPASF